MNDREAKEILEADLELMEFTFTERKKEAYRLAIIALSNTSERE